MSSNLQVRFVRAPKGWIDADCFRLEHAPMPAPAEGEVLVRNLYLSIDPYQRRQMNPATHYADKLQPGEVMVGRTVGVVVESRNAQFRVGDHVFGPLGWRQFATSTGRGLSTVDADLEPLSIHLGALGTPGVTAWVGLLDIARPKAGETVVVSAAAGAVGSVVGQLARRAGARAVGIAGSAQKCRFAVREFGFDASVDHSAADFDEQLAVATPAGIDVDFENAGGAVLDAVLARMNDFGRVAICGMVSQYNRDEPYCLRHFGEVLERNLTVGGFRIGNYAARREAALADLTAMFRRGELNYQETVTVGLENAPAALIGMLRGENFGKQVVKIVAED